MCVCMCENGRKSSCDVDWWEKGAQEDGHQAYLGCCWRTCVGTGAYEDCNTVKTWLKGFK